MKTTVPLAEAKNKLSELIDQVQRGDEVIITRHGKEAARLGPVGRVSAAEAMERIARFETFREQNILNPPGAEKITTKDLIDEGRRF